MPPATAVLIGRFQPFHRGHAALLRIALEAAPRVVLVLGSAGGARTPRNPFTAAEREAAIRSTLSESDNLRVAVLGQRDVWDSGRWARQVRRAVEAGSPAPHALVGFRKDDPTGDYLSLFPGWSWIDAGRQGPLDATPLRERILSEQPVPDLLADLAPSLPDPVAGWLADWCERGPREELAADARAERAYSERWGEGPFVAVDAVVRALGHVLLIRRGARPGRGLFAFPGGFLEPREEMLEGARRELREETGLVLDMAPTASEPFTHPGRSARARILTRAFLFEPLWDRLPEVVGGDDAASAQWVPESELPPLEDRFFEDHFHIASRFLPGLVPD